MTGMNTKHSTRLMLSMLVLVLAGGAPFASAARGQVDGHSQLAGQPVVEQKLDVAIDPFAQRIAQKLPRPVVKYRPGQLPGQVWPERGRSLEVVVFALALLGTTVYLWPRLD